MGSSCWGLTRPYVKWQAQEQRGFDAQSFQIGWERHQAICPEGHASVSWTPAVDNRPTAVIKVKFSMRDCMPCPNGSKCIRSRNRYQRRTITIRPQAHFLALQARRAREQTAEYAAEYTRRRVSRRRSHRACGCCGRAAAFWEVRRIRAGDPVFGTLPLDAQAPQQLACRLVVDCARGQALRHTDVGVKSEIVCTLGSLVDPTTHTC